MSTLRTDEPFLNYYQLSHDPFATRVPNFKFFVAQRKTILGQLHHLARHSQLILIVTGPKGSGKTLLRQALMASVNKETVKIINVSAADYQTVSSVLALLATELQTTENTIVAIIEQIKKLSEKNVSLYFMIDDADQVSEDVTQLLLNLANEQLLGLHLFLFARPSLLDRFEDSIIGKEVTFNLPLAPYTLEEAKEYLALRLDGAGQDLDLFSNKQILDIYTQSGGWPGMINQVAKDVLLENMQNTQLSAEPMDNEGLDDGLYATPTSATRVKPKLFFPKKHLIIAGVVAVCLVIALLFSRNKPEEDQQPSIVATTNQSAQVTDPIDQVTQDLPLSAIDTHNEVTTNNTSLPISVDTAVPTEATAIATPATNEQEVTPKPEVEVATTTPTDAPVTPATPVKETSQPVTPTKSTINKPTAQGNVWYRNQQGGHFTIQVSVAANEKAAKDFIAKQGAGYHYFKRSRAGRVDYVITHGEFAKRADAQAFIKKLPTVIQQSKPWIRTFASIKQELVK